jgi:hypothetical protein
MASTTEPEGDAAGQRDARRCPSCGALVTWDAGWCGQCLTVLSERPAPAPGSPERSVLGAPAITAVARPEPATAIVTDAPEGPSWTCPACGEANPLSVDACTVCGTSFKVLFRAPERSVDLDPRSAMISSLMLPGLGHIRLGRVAEGIARLVLFAWAVATAAMVLLSAPAEGRGPLGLLAAMFATAALAVYVLSAVDARRAAEKLEPVLSTRALLYGSAGLVLLSMASLGLLVLRVVS